MSYRNIEEQRAWMNRRYRVQRAFFIDIMGGKCKKCGSESDLQFDHVDPTKKTISVSRLVGRRRLLYVLKELVEQCQLLCGKCHREKTAQDYKVAPRRFTHGTLYGWMKAKCKCDVCATAMRAWYDRRNETRRRRRPVGELA